MRTTSGLRGSEEARQKEVRAMEYHQIAALLGSAAAVLLFIGMFIYRMFKD